MPRYRVIVHDNFHYQQADARRDAGAHETVEAATAACRAIVDRSLAEEMRPGISAERLFDRYMSFGEDPSIIVVGGDDRGAAFSAWDYAKERCRELCREG
jgi:hypothetical protein